jgi:hypothetical protein
MGQHQHYQQLQMGDVEGLGDSLDAKAPNIHDHTEFAKLPYIGTVPAGSATPTITHNLGTLDVEVVVIRSTDGVEVGVPSTRNGVDSVILTFGTAPTANQYRVIVSAGHGNGGTGDGGGTAGPHAATHASTGTDPVTPAAIGAAATTHTHSSYSLTSHVHGAYALEDHTHEATGPGGVKPYPPVLASAPDGTTRTINAALSNHFRVDFANDCTLMAPTNPTDGQMILLELFCTATATANSGLGYTMQFQTGVNNGWQLGSDVPSAMNCLGQTLMYYSAIYDSRAASNTGRWRLMSMVQGYQYDGTFNLPVL